jgi:DNA polymerase-3 subunit beta
MEFKIQKKDILRGLERTLTVVERRNTMPSLNHALFELKDDVLQISATDLEIFVSSTMGCRSLTSGRLAVPARSVYDIVKECSDSEDIHFRGVQGNRVEIISGKSQFRLLGLPSDSFPHFKASPKGQLSSAKLSTKEFLKLLQKTEYSVCLEEIRYFLTGIYLETIHDESGTSSLRAVATDGHRLALMETSSQVLGTLNLKKGLIIPKKGVGELRKILESSNSDQFELTCDENLFRVSTGELNLWVRPIDGEYPDYKRVIPTSLANLVKADRNEMLNSLRRMALLVSDRSKVVTFEFKKNRLILSTTNPELGEANDEVSVDYNGPEIKSGFNVRFFLDALSHFEGDQVELFIGEKLQPAIMRSPANPGYTVVVMPMRI